MATPAERVNDALENLDDKQLKKFHFQLQMAPNLEGQKLIKKQELQNKDTMDTALLIVEYYPKHVDQIMVNVLTKISRNDLTDSFKVVPETSGNSAASSQEPNTAQAGTASGPAPGSTASSPEVDFVTKHRGDLIQRVSMVDAILDLLVDEGVMQAEDYGDVRAAPTTVKKMRELFILLDKRGVKAKRVFYKGLEKNEAFLLDDLKSQ